MVKATAFSGNGACDMMSYEEFTQKEAVLENAPRAEREKFYADILEKETGKTDVRMMAYFHASLLHYREGDFRAAREILEPFVIDYQSYAYRPEIIACFNLMGVAAYCECAYALARFYIREGLKIAREHKEASRYSYEYNNLAVTYLAQRDYEKALDAIREAEQNLPQSDKKMHAYVYRNLAEFSNAASNLFDCAMDAGDSVQIEHILAAMDDYLTRNPQEIQIGVRMQEMCYTYAKSRDDRDAMLAAMEKKDQYNIKLLEHAEEVRVRDVDRYLRMGQQLQQALANEASANRTKTRFLANMSHDIRTPPSTASWAC